MARRMTRRLLPNRLHPACESFGNPIKANRLLEIEWAPQKLERQLAAVVDSTLAVCSGHHEVPLTACLPYSGAKLSYIPVAKNFQPAEIFRNGSPCIPSTVVVRKNSRVRFSEWSKYGEDTLYLLDLCRVGKVEIVREHLAYYRKTPGSQSHLLNIDCLRHVSLEEWIERNRSTLTIDEINAFQQKMDEGLLERARWALYKRNWPIFEAIQEFVRKRPDYARRSELLSLRKLPRVCYSLRDAIRSISRTFRRSGASAEQINYAKTLND
jgi:hypothetical protein